MLRRVRIIFLDNPGGENPQSSLLIRAANSIFNKILNDRVIWQRAPSLKLQSEAQKYPAYNYYQSIRDRETISKTWVKTLRLREFKLPYVALLDNDDLAAIAAQKLENEYGCLYSFAKLCDHVFQNDMLYFVVSAPKEIRRTFNRFGLRTLEFPSAIANSFGSTKIMLRSITVYVRKLFKLFHDYWTFSKSDSTFPAPSVFWFTLTASEFKDPEKGLSIVEFVKFANFKILERHSRNRPGVFLENSAVKRQLLHEENISIGRDPFACPGRNPIKLSALLCQITEQVKGIIWTFTNFLLGRWWSSLFSLEAADFPRAVEWFRDVRPTYLLRSDTHSEEALWFYLGRTFGTKIGRVFYSTNVRPREYVDSFTGANLPTYFLIRADKLFVWSIEQKAWLQQLGYSDDRLEVCGPIVYGRYPEKRTPWKKKTLGSQFLVSAFDVLPVATQRLVSLGIGEFYYSVSNVCRFLEDIIAACEASFGKDHYKILYKPKRVKHWANHGDYWSKLEALVKLPNFELLDPALNPMLAVIDSDAVITMPYTSLPYIGQYYKIPSCFYDALSKIKNNMLTEDLFPLLYGRNQLQQWLTDQCIEASDQADRELSVR